MNIYRVEGHNRYHWQGPLDDIELELDLVHHIHGVGGGHCRHEGIVTVVLVSNY